LRLIDILIDWMPRRVRARVVQREEIGKWLADTSKEWSK
jgi:hypothetical protein